nr:uncharacterized protein LOC131781155 [Pocillopora verrucosa]
MRIGIKACVVMIPLLGVRWYSVSSRLYMKLSFTSSPYSTLLKSVFAGFPNFRSTLHAKHSDQRAIQKKDEHRFSIFFKEQLHKEEPQVNPNEVGDVWAIELLSCAEFESKSHLT